MNRLAVVLLLVIMSFTVSAKRSKFHLGITGGVNTVLLTNDKYLQQDGSIMGVQMTLKAMRNWRKWQFGGGVEIGSMYGNVNKMQILESSRLGEARGRINSSGQKITSPYFAPHIRFNHKIKFPRVVYMYVGGMGGMMLATNTVGSSKAASGWMAGANVGVVIKMNKLISLDISEGWRATQLSGVSSDIQNHIVHDYASNTYTYSTVDYDVMMNYFNFNVGLRFKL